MREAKNFEKVYIGGHPNRYNITNTAQAAFWSAHMAFSNVMRACQTCSVHADCRVFVCVFLVCRSIYVGTYACSAAHPLEGSAARCGRAGGAPHFLEGASSFCTCLADRPIVTSLHPLFGRTWNDVNDADDDDDDEMMLIINMRTIIHFSVYHPNISVKTLHIKLRLHCTFFYFAFLCFSIL